ncbi:MAG: HD-GYP domain-containing protein [Pyrinomonadaceae bacterium]
MQAQLTREERVTQEILARLAQAADEFENYAHPHAARVARIADELATAFGLGGADRSSLRWAALGHDLGELAMLRDYIHRRGALTADERIDLARHPVIGEQEIARVGADRGAQLLVRWHHEWWNGTGYPDALRREQIPLAARLLRAADAYAALTDARPFRPAYTEEDARRHLTEWAGIEFDPQVVRALLSLHGVAELRSFARSEPPTQSLSPPETVLPVLAVQWNGNAGQPADVKPLSPPQGTNPDAPPQPAEPQQQAATAGETFDTSDTANHA